MQEIKKYFQQLIAIESNPHLEKYFPEYTGGQDGDVMKSLPRQLVLKSILGPICDIRDLIIFQLITPLSPICRQY